MSCACETDMICASGSVVEYRLAKARVAGSNPVSRLTIFVRSSLFMRLLAIFCFWSFEYP
jgi:hypothetical protein